MKRNKLILGLLMGLTFTFSVPSIQPAYSQLRTSAEDGLLQTIAGVDIDWTDGLIRVTGYGHPPDRGNATQKRLLARRAAMADGFRRMLDALYRIHVDSETLVKDFVQESKLIKNQINELIKSAQKVDQRVLPSGLVEVDMVIKLYSEMKGLSGIIQPQKKRISPIPLDLKPRTVDDDYTSVIVDCRGLGMVPAMRPAIIDQDSGGQLYVGSHSLQPSVVLEKGLVTYARSLNQARRTSRAGYNPLIIRGLRGSGLFKTDVTISEKDVRMILGVEENTQVLSMSKVIFVI